MNWRLIRLIDSGIGIPAVQLLRCAGLFRKRACGITRGKEPSRILLIKFWGIGNIFMLLPVIRSLRTTWSQAKIDFLTLESNREALGMADAVDTILSVDTSGYLAFLGSFKATGKVLRRGKYDLVIDFEQFARFSALLSNYTGAGRTIGFETRNQQRHYLYTDAIAYDNDVHITRSFHALARHAGATTGFESRVPLRRIGELREQGKSLLARFQVDPGSFAVVMHIGTSENFRERRWPPQQYAALADLLIEKYGVTVLMTGLPEERYLIEKALGHLRVPASVVDLGGKLSFREYLALISIADLVISADTAAIHLASVLDIPVAGLYGPNTPQLYGPWGKDGLALYANYRCSPCITNFNSKINTCRHPEGRGACMKALTVREVFHALERRYFTPDADTLLKIRRGELE